MKGGTISYAVFQSISVGAQVVALTLFSIYQNETTYFMTNYWCRYLTKQKHNKTLINLLLLK